MATIQSYDMQLFFNEPSKIGEPLTFAIEVENFTNKPLPEAQLIVFSNDYFRQGMIQFPAVPVNGTKKVSMTIRVNQNVVEEDIPRTMDLQYGRDKRSYNFPVYCYTGDLRVMKPSARAGSSNFNILLFGIAGATKSSFINSALTLLNSSYSTIVQAAVGGSSGHVTKSLRRFPLDKEYNVNINLWDTWGLVPNTYEGNELQYICEGILPSNWEMDDKVEGDAYLQSAAVQSTKDSRRIHAVIFFITHASLNDGESVNLIKTNYQYLQQLEMNPILVLTKADEVIASLRSNPLARTPESEALIGKAARTLNIPENRIYFGVNYIKTNEKKSFAIDKGNFAILEHAIRTAESNATKFYR